MTLELPRIIKYRSGFAAQLPSRAAYCAKDAPKLHDGHPIFLPSYVKESSYKNPLDPHAAPSYSIMLVGVRPSGERINVQIVGIQPYFEVHLRDATDTTINTHINVVRNILEGNRRTTPVRTVAFKAKPLKGYQQHRSYFLRMFYTTLDSRKQAIETIRRRGYETASDDLRDYHHVVARDAQVSFSKWIILKDASCVAQPSMRGQTLVCGIRGVTKYVGPVLPYMKAERTMSAAWDIETYSPTADLPDPEDRRNCIFTASATFQWISDAAPFARFCVVSNVVAQSTQYTTILCASEREIFLAWAELLGHYQPEFILGFNDSGYDWPWVVKRAAMYPGVLADMSVHLNGENPYRAMSDANMLSPYVYRETKVKLEAGGVDIIGHSIMLPGYIPVDVRTMFRKMNPKSEKSSLAYYLAENKLGTKYDMPIPYMFRIYREYLDFAKAHPDIINQASQNFADLPFAAHESLQPDAAEAYLAANAPADNAPADANDKPDDDDREHESDRESDEENIDDEPDPKHDTQARTVGARGPFYPQDCTTPADRFAFLLEKLAEINLYCVIDAQKCHELFRKRNIFMGCREVGDMAFCTMYAAIYRANGMKVRNLTISFAQQSYFGCRCSNIERQADAIEKEKYPGAFVFPPKKGLYASKLTMRDRKIRAAKLAEDNALMAAGGNQASTEAWLGVSDEEISRAERFIAAQGRAVFSREELDTTENSNTESTNVFSPPVRQFLEEPIGRPITGLDFSSLYPSLIRAYNFSPEYFIQSPSEAAALRLQGHRLTEVDFDFAGKRRLGWFLWHNNAMDPTKPDFRFGVFPYILDWLYKERDRVRAPLKPLEEKVEIFRKRVADGYQPTPEELAEIDNDNFEISCITAKQAAIKVFMNTFYGESGNKCSPLFIVELAGGITTYGQRNIKAAFEKVCSMGCSVYYGDTDSLYISMPENIFATVDTQHYSNQLDRPQYWTAMVELTMKHINEVRDTVNAMFVADNGTNFLSMAYEEVLYPTVLTAKKKYYGTPHKKIVNFEAPLFIRGLDVVKRGNSKLAIEACEDIMHKSMQSDNLYTILELVIKKITEIYATEWPLEKFARSERLSIMKQNIRHRRFYERMRSRGYTDIEPNERFTFVYIQCYPYAYDHRGRKQPIKAGDRMEPYDYAKKHNLRVDLDYYFQSQIDGQLARLITYHPMFYSAPADTSDAEAKKAEDRTYKTAKRFVAELRQPHIVKYNELGRSYQAIVKRADREVIAALEARVDPTVTRLIYKNKGFANLREFIIEQAEQEAQAQCISQSYGKCFVERYIRSREMTIGKHLSANPALLGPHKNLRSYVVSEMFKAMCGERGTCISDRREQIHQETIANLSIELENRLPALAPLFDSAAHSQAEILKTVSRAIGPAVLEPQAEAKQIDLDEIAAEQIERSVTSYVEGEAAKYDCAEMREAVRSMRNLYASFLSSYVAVHHTRSVVAYLKALRAANVGLAIQPADIEQIKRKMIEELVNGAQI